ncbi:MAG: hypothetical protein GX131_19485 [candidate division WS1 bacterium]|nr:hypothetical protein [candidate division WS1 bacterium]
MMRALLTLILIALTLVACFAEREEFVLPQETQTRMWRLTNDSSWRDWANYHIRNCWSPDGRYVCTVRHRQFDMWQDGGVRVRVIDVATGEVIRTFDRANTPRWAHRHNWLFFVQMPEEGGTWNIMRWDLDADSLTQLQGHSSYLGSTDWQDEFIYASRVTLDDGTGMAGAAVPINGGEPIPLELGGQLDGNPSHPRVFTRISNYFEAFKPTRVVFDTDGSNMGVISPTLQQCHQSWSGGGEWYLFGNQPMKGRRWDEPFPSNHHYLSAIMASDICRGARTDRYLIGTGATGPINFADLRSGGGWTVVPEALSYIHDSEYFQYSGDSANYDCDGKGSPDGTKICFVSTYDLRDGPLTHIAAIASEETGPGLHVRSTEGFPEQGRLSIRTEVIGYERKTETTFEGLRRGMYGTGPNNLRTMPAERLKALTDYPSDLRPGTTVTSFDARLIPEKQREGMSVPVRFTRDDWAEPDSPLIWQRRTDVYVAIVRDPDRPWLRRQGDRVELIPGELHFETRGYRILRDGEALGDELLAPGANLQLEPGEYTAVAVEHSGLESPASNALRTDAATTLHLLADAPEDFAWTQDRWLVADAPVDERAAHAAPEAVREIVHRYDGVIHREWYERGELVRRHDLDHDDFAVRRLLYEDGRLARREYHTEASLQTWEDFDADGFITECGYNRNGEPWDQWWFVKGTPVRHWTARGGHHTASADGGGTYMKQGIEWVKVGE